MRYWNIVFSALMLASNLAFCQYTDNYQKKALTAFHSKDYASALLFSEKVLEIDTANIVSMFIAGEAARLSNDLEKAEFFLESIPNEAKVGYYAVCDFYLATVKLDLDKQGEAKHYFEKYLNEHNEANNLFAYLAIEALKLMEDEVDKAKPHCAQNIPGNLNSHGPAYAPLRYADKLYYTAMTDMKGKKRQKNAQVSRVFEARGNYPPTLFAGNPENESLSCGNISLTADGSRVYYTLCKGNFTESEGCEIWFREKEYEGTWGPPKRLPEPVNLKGYTTTQPSIAWDRIEKQHVLYFSSNRPGGVGGMDIWCSVMQKDGSFGQPTCLPFNTPKDDITPFFHQVTQTLFFSSNGWPGKGGFDVFRETKKATGEWRTPENLGEWINTNFDDSHYTFHTQSQNAYLISNRPNVGRAASSQENVSDIYEARIFVELEVKVFRASDNQPVFAPQVTLTQLNAQEVGSFAARDDQSNLTLRLETGKRYMLTVTAEGYTPVTFEYSTEEISYFIKQKRQVFLRQPPGP